MPKAAIDCADKSENKESAIEKGERNNLYVNSYFSRFLILIFVGQIVVRVTALLRSSLKIEPSVCVDINLKSAVIHFLNGIIIEMEIV